MSEIIGKKVRPTDLARENDRDNKRRKCPATSTKNLASKDGWYYPILVVYSHNPQTIRLIRPNRLQTASGREDIDCDIYYRGKQF